MATRGAVCLGVIVAALWSPATAVLAAARSAAQAPRTLSASVLVITSQTGDRQPQRPPVEFDHDRHTVTLAPEPCETCHQVSEAGVLDPRFAAVVGASRWDERMDAFHDACIGCHAERAQHAASGPQVCGGCHIRRPLTVSARVEMSFDLSLHGRHDQAYPERCETCHHVWDPEKEALVHLKGAEAACRTCHRLQAVKRTPSRAEASHRACVSCHLRLVEAAAVAGPVSCVGCHDAARVAAVRRLEEVPRLLRGQPDRTWVAVADGVWPAVPFDHLRHEGAAASCSGCHHESMARCGDCHTQRGVPEGAGITLAEAYHDPWSEHSCVGCHRRQTASPECRGCHAGGTGEASQRSCTICHSGPAPRLVVEGAVPVELSPVDLGALPDSPEDLPEEVVIDVLADRYQPSRLPHGKIVRRLHGAVLESRLAQRFHGDAMVGCAGCHHHSPASTRPPRCVSCHGDSADPRRDRPDLKTAYHRQCLECHEQMGIAAVGCTDCHAAREVES